MTLYHNTPLHFNSASTFLISLWNNLNFQIQSIISYLIYPKFLLRDPKLYVFHSNNILTLPIYFTMTSLIVSNYEHTQFILTTPSFTPLHTMLPLWISHQTKLPETTLPNPCPSSYIIMQSHLFILLSHS